MAEKVKLSASSSVAEKQLFHELKSQYPDRPDEFIYLCMRDYYHNREQCEQALEVPDHRKPNQTRRQFNEITNKSPKNALETLLLHAKNSLNKVGHHTVEKNDIVPNRLDDTRRQFPSDNRIWRENGRVNSEINLFDVKPTGNRRKSFDDSMWRESNAKKSPKPDVITRPTTLHLHKPLNDLVKPSASNQISNVPSYSSSLNVSVNLNLELSDRAYSIHPSADNITTVNLTVSTPEFSPDAKSTSPGHVQITVHRVSPSHSNPNKRPYSYTPNLPASPVELHARAESLPNLNCSLIKRQLERKKRLELALAMERRRLAQMTVEVTRMEAIALNNALENLAVREMQLRRKIAILLDKCKMLTDEVDRKSQSTGGVPLGETSEEFYKNIYTGQQGRLILQESSRDPESESAWACEVCTLENHPLLNNCEACHMPRVISGKKYVQQLDSVARMFSNWTNVL